MIKPFSNRDLYPILEAYRMICEDVEGKNINRAEKYIKLNQSQIVGRNINGTILTPRKITEEVRNMIPNSRLAKCKFLTGVTRIFFEDMFKDKDNMHSKANKLNKTLKLVASDAHVNEYDINLNGLSYDEIVNRFAMNVQQDIDNDIAANAEISKSLTRNNDYNIVKIESFEQSEEYGKYTDWCVTHYEDMYNQYTHNGLGVFYFCLKNGFEDVEDNPGENTPMDEYGLSMIAISVNDDGSLNTCTCRWNHANGGNDNMMTTEEISQFFGVNFYETFKPISEEEKTKRIYDAFYSAFSLNTNNSSIDDNGTVSFIADFRDLEPLFEYNNRDSIDFDTIKDFLTNDDEFDLAYKHFYSDSVIDWTYAPHDKFDMKMSDYGINFEQTIRAIHDDNYDESDTDGKISNEAASDIREIMEENFGGSGCYIDVIYRDAETLGMVRDYRNELKKDLFNECDFLDEEYGIKYNENSKPKYTVKIVMPKKEILRFAKRYDGDDNPFGFLKDSSVNIYPLDVGGSIDKDFWVGYLDDFANQIIEVLKKDKIRKMYPKNQMLFDFMNMKQN